MDSRDVSEPRTGRGWTRDQVDAIISRLLRLGLTISAALVLIGAVVYLVRHGGEAAAYRVFRGQPRAYREIASILRESVGFHGRGLIMAGLIVLVATPVARVMFSVVAFLREHDTVYVAVTLFVLAVLLFSVFWLGLR